MITETIGIAVSGDEWKQGAATTGDEWKRADYDPEIPETPENAPEESFQTEKGIPLVKTESYTHTISISVRDIVIDLLDVSQPFSDHLATAMNVLEKGSVDACYDIIFRKADMAFRYGHFDYVDDVFQSINIDGLPIKALLALFTITKHAKAYLPKRERAFERFEERVKTDRPDLIRRSNRLK